MQAPKTHSALSVVVCGQGGAEGGVWQFTIRVHMHRPQDKPGRAGATEQQKCMVFSWWCAWMWSDVLQSPLHSPVGCLLTGVFNLLWFYFSLLYDFQTLLSSENLSLSNILYLKLIKVELLWIKVGVSLGPPTQPLLSSHQALCYLHRTPVTLWNTLWKPLLCPELWLSRSFTFPQDLI